MNHAEVCPICKGTGKVEAGENLERNCHGCGGLGWITVVDSAQPSHVGVPYIPFLPFHPTAPYPWTIFWPLGITITWEIKP